MHFRYSVLERNESICQHHRQRFPIFHKKLLFNLKKTSSQEFKLISLLQTKSHVIPKIMRPSQKSSRSEMFYKNDVLKNFAKFTGKQLQSILIKLQACNLGQNLFRLFQVLVQIPFTTSETELDYYQQKVNVRVASRIIE